MTYPPVLTQLASVSSIPNHASGISKAGHAGKASYVTYFEIENYTQSPTEVLHRGGHPFVEGAVPKSHVLEVRRDGVVVRAQFDARAYCSEGRLRFAVIHMQDTPLLPGESRRYEIWSKPGVWDNSSTLPLASVVDALALKLVASEHKSWNGAVSAAFKGGGGIASLAVHAARASRVVKVHSGPVSDGYEVWGMFGHGDGDDEHLKTTWYFNAWKNAAGEVICYDHAAIVSQDWWGVEGKTRRDYTMAYYQGNRLVQTYKKVEHPYHSQWGTLRLENDHNHAKRQWSVSPPTLLYKPCKEYWIETGFITPFDLSVEPVELIYTGGARRAGKTIGNYIPCEEIDHRGDVNSTGGYMGRPMMPDCDAKAFLRQTPNSARIARANGLAGLGYPGHYKDQRLCGSDISNKLIPLVCMPKEAEYSAVPGLAAPKHAYTGAHTERAFLSDWVEPKGGQGTWVVNSYIGDMSHGVSYCAYSYLVEGEPYMLRAMVDLAMNTIHGCNANTGGSTPQARWLSNPYAAKEMRIADTRWSAVPNMAMQERAMGLAANIYAPAVALSPDGDPQTQYLKKWLAHVDDYVMDYLLTTPASARKAGLMYTGDNGKRVTWMDGFGVQGFYQVWRMNGSKGFKAYASMQAAFLYAMLERCPYDTLTDRIHHLPCSLPYSPENDFLSRSEYLVPRTVTIEAGRLTTVQGFYPITEGDVFYFLEGKLPSGVEQATKFYAVEVDGKETLPGMYRSCKLSLTKGGAAHALEAGTFTVGARMMGGNTANLQVASYPPYLPPADSYSPILQAGLAMAETCGSASVPKGSTERMRVFLSKSARASYPGWALAVPSPL